MKGQDTAQTPARLYRCSFCCKSQTEVRTLISGPGVFICDECIELGQIITNKEAEAASTPA